jgi:hypothetical protein
MRFLLATGNSAAIDLGDTSGDHARRHVAERGAQGVSLMARKNSDEEKPTRGIVRKNDQLIVTLDGTEEHKQFEQLLRDKCAEVGLAQPQFIPYGSGQKVIVVCKNRDHAIFVLDYAEEALTELSA